MPVGQGIISSSLCICNSEEPKWTSISPITDPAKRNPSTLLPAKPTGQYPTPLSGRIPSDQSKSRQQGLHFSSLRWPVADPCRCVKNIPARDQDQTPSSWFPWTPPFCGPQSGTRMSLAEGWMCVCVCVRAGGRRAAFAGGKAGVQTGVLLPIQLPHSWQDRLAMPSLPLRLPHGRWERKSGSPWGGLARAANREPSSGAGCPAGFD